MSAQTPGVQDTVRSVFRDKRCTYVLNSGAESRMQWLEKGIFGSNLKALQFKRPFHS